LCQVLATRNKFGALEERTSRKVWAWARRRPLMKWSGTLRLENKTIKRLLNG